MLTRRLAAELMATALLVALTLSASARSHHRHHHRHGHYFRSAIHHHVHRSRAFRGGHRALPRAGHGGLVTVQTAAGIPITVASWMASSFQGFISDIVAAGYHPRHIGCYAAGGHVPASRHYWGGACDFDQTGWGLTAPFMYHAGQFARRWNLRDGCAYFRRDGRGRRYGRGDCGHIDAPHRRLG